MGLERADSINIQDYRVSDLLFTLLFCECISFKKVLVYFVNMSISTSTAC